MVWLQCWRDNPRSPGARYEEWQKARKGARAGGLKKDNCEPKGVGPTRWSMVGEAEREVPERQDRGPTLKTEGPAVAPNARPVRKSPAAIEAEGLVKPAAGKPLWGRGSGEAPAPSRPHLGGTSFERDLKELRLGYVIARVAQGTHKGYQVGWRQWGWFLRARGRDPMLFGRTEEERTADEELLLDFIVHLAHFMKRAEGTIKGKVFAVRHFHIINGFADPLSGKPRIFMALEGVKRLQGGRKRKHPVTTGMLRWVSRRLYTEYFDDIVLDCAVKTGWFFLLRVGEFAQSGGTWSLRRILLGVDVTFRSRNQEVRRAREADELVLNLKGSKTDQYNGAGRG